MHGLSNVQVLGWAPAELLAESGPKTSIFYSFCRLSGGKLSAGLPEKGLREHLFPGYGSSAVVSETKSREFPVGV
jgi:hypothetical protein